MPWYTNKTQTNFGQVGPEQPPTYQVKKDANGNDIKILDPRTGEFVNYYLHTRPEAASSVPYGHATFNAYSFVHL